MCVIVPNFNDLNNVNDCLGSVFSQSIPFDQVIFIDDASTDESVAFVQQVIENRPEVLFIANTVNKGTALSINQALKHCSCDYVLFLSANDFISPYLVERFHATIKEGAGFWSALCQNVSEDGTIFSPRKTPVIVSSPSFFSPSQTIELIRIYTNWSPGTTVLYHREKVIEHGGLSAPLKGLADWLLAIIIGVKSGVVFVPEILGTVRLHANSYLSFTLQNEVHLQSKIENYLRDQLALMPDLKSTEVDMIVGKVAGRLELNLIFGMIRYSGSTLTRLFRIFRFGYLLLRFALSSGFLRLIMAKYIWYMRIFNSVSH